MSEIDVVVAMRTQQQTWQLVKINNSKDDLDEDGRCELHSAAALGTPALP